MSELDRPLMIILPMESTLRVFALCGEAIADELSRLERTEPKTRLDKALIQVVRGELEFVKSAEKEALSYTHAPK